MNYIAFDTETNGLPIDPSLTDYYAVANWPRIYQLAAILFDSYGFELGRMNKLIKPNGWKIPTLDPMLAEMGEKDFFADKITTEELMDVGVPIHQAIEEFVALANRAEGKVAHNMLFDNPVLICEFFRAKHFPPHWNTKQSFCTKELMTPICAIPSGWKSGGYKWPTLQEAHKHLFGREFDGAHDAMADVQATVDVFLEIEWMI